MNFRRNMGIILMLLGVLLTINQSDVNNELIENIKNIVETYWPLIISFIGVYFISFPRRRR